MPDISVLENFDLKFFRISDVDQSGDPAYYGFVNENGNWYIMEENVANGTYRYISGTSSYTTNWTGRAGLSYDYYYTEFS